jgi:uncharacterized protein involved in type VI secretion and phage assembly
MTYGIERLSVFPGMYRAVVDRTDDPEQRGRIQVRVPTVSGAINTINVWVKPAIMGAGAARGWFWPPDEGDVVYVSFRQGSPGKPEFYVGGFYGYPDQKTEVPSELGYGGNDLPERRGLRTRAGHSFTFNDEAGEEAIELVWNQPDDNPDDRTISADAGTQMSLKFTKDGIIILTDKEAQTITVDGNNKQIVIEDANGNVVTCDSEGVTIKSDAIKLSDQADTEAMRFSDWQQWAVAHTHPTGTGPSGPPTEPIPNSVASSVVKLK